MKKLNLTKLVLATAISLLLYNCESNSEEVVEVEPVAEVVSMCLSDVKNAEGDKARGVSTPSKHWVNGQTIRVKFLNGTTRFQTKVKEYASEWEKYANIKFEWVSRNSQADIKIKFDANGGHWSNLGTDSKYYEHSMNLGYEDNGSSTYGFRSTTIHEFGHALGLNHEHRNPSAGIKWNKPVVYNYYAAPPNNWSKATVDSNIFAQLDRNSSNYSEYDPKSIMHYPINASHTLDGFSVGNNDKLSAIDKEYISEVYPGGANTGGGNICKGVANYNGNISYSVGDKVIFKGYVFKRTRNDWINLGACTN
ncbi:M12 family metallopeptidase [Tenacibaculum ovolyticum]|uniref:M12 family metallopeptidase n=1 Tax=Tenacibaculum ovolyticum TaxID=104270 RepID=UPI001EEE6004|nr:M12 family metallopeptidase [Tenacibaculum ovolyticum]